MNKVNYTFRDILYLVTSLKPVADTPWRQLTLTLTTNPNFHQFCTNNAPFTINKQQNDTYTQGEVTSQSLWPRYDRHFVGITRHDALS